MRACVCRHIYIVLFPTGNVIGEKKEGEGNLAKGYVLRKRHFDWIGKVWLICARGRIFNYAGDPGS